METRTPAILTTSHLLTTGVDAPTCKNVVLVRTVGSMPEFKQIIGRGTRLRPDYGKLAFNIIDYTGTATEKFADPTFDGQPLDTRKEILSLEGEVLQMEVHDPPDETGYAAISEDPPGDSADDLPRKFYVDGGEVEIIRHLVYELDPEGKKLACRRLTDYTGDKVRTLYPNAPALRRDWLDTDRRAEIVEQLAERGIDLETLAETAGKPEADAFDLLCHLAYNAPLRTRRERADRVKREESAFFSRFGPEARAVLDALIEKYAEHGSAQFKLPDVLEVPPFIQWGNVIELASRFGGSHRLREAVNDLQRLIYAA